MAVIPKSTTGGLTIAAPGAKGALVLLLLINLFNYIDRQILSAVMPYLQQDGNLFPPGDEWAQSKAGLLTSAFMAAYLVFSPIVGWLDGHGFKRWIILGIGVTLWSLASGFSGFATTYVMLLLTRCCVGVGEGAYGPVASAMLSDAFPVKSRGWVMALFNMAIPVGSALGFVIGGQIAGATGRWQHAFWFTFLGLALGMYCFTRKELPRPPISVGDLKKSYLSTLRQLTEIRSFVLCCLGMTAITYTIGGVAAWAPAYFYQRETKFILNAEAFNRMTEKDSKVTAETMVALQSQKSDSAMSYTEMNKILVNTFGKNKNDQTESILEAARTRDSMSLGGLTTIFGGILVIGGLVATAAGAWLTSKLRDRIRGAEFQVIGWGALFAAPNFIAFLYTPFPLAWGFVFLAIFGLFLHTGPAFTLLANVTPSPIRATAFAMNILVIHLLGDMISPTIIGITADFTSLQTGMTVTTVFIIIGGIIWLFGAKYLAGDMAKVPD